MTTHQALVPRASRPRGELAIGGEPASASIRLLHTDLTGCLGVVQLALLFTDVDRAQLQSADI